MQVTPSTSTDTSDLIDTPTKILPPRRTLNKLGLAVLAIFIGIIGQIALNGNNLWDGLIFYILATFLFVKAVGQTKKIIYPFSPYRGLFASIEIYGGIRRVLGLVLIITALITSIVGQLKFNQVQTHSQAWYWYGISIFVFIMGILIFSKNKFSSFKDSFKNSKTFFSNIINPYMITLFIIIVIAIGLRIWSFDAIPYGVWFDEAEAGLQARNWLSNPQYKPPFYTPINISGQFLLFYSFALKFISNSVYGIRIISVLFGVGGVLVAYLFGNQIQGPILGLSMAFFLAVMRWDINFSRIAMTGIDTPFFELLTLFYLSRLLRYGNLRDAAFAGLAIGFGLSFYTAFRLFILALALFALLGCIIWPHWWKKLNHLNWWKNQGFRLAIVVLGTWISLMPVGQFALNHPEDYWSRVQTTSITTRRDDPNLSSALTNSLKKHLLMFHIKGDKNGRHNLPGEPMLDPAMGLLMVFGLGLAIKNIKKPSNLFFVLLFPISLLGGILSLDFEAPQALRSIAVLPVIAYFCALPVLSLAEESKKVLYPLPLRWLLWPTGLIALYIFGLNAHTYFIKQANNFAVWNAFSTPETITGKKMAELGPDYDFYLSPFFINQPAIHFLSPQTPQHNTLSLPDALPIRSDGNRPVAIFIHPDDKLVFEQAQNFYPDGVFETESNMPQDVPAIYIVVLSASDIASVQGLALRYWAGSQIQTQQIPVRALQASTIDVDWSATMPLTPPFIAEWEGVLYASEYGPYQLDVNAPGEVILELDGYQIISDKGQQEATVELARGNHSFRLQVASSEGRGQVQLKWQPPKEIQKTLIPASAFYSTPVTNNGLLGKYYPNANFSGKPALMQIDSMLNTYFHFVPLDKRPYSVEWTGFLDVPETGIYSLGLQAVGDAQLFIDDALFLDTTTDNEYIAEDMPLQVGLHEIKVLFLDYKSNSRIHLYWTPPNATIETPIPSKNLWPPMGEAWQFNNNKASATTKFEPQPIALSYITTLNDGLIEPRDVAVGPQGNIYVADSGFKGVVAFYDYKLDMNWQDTSDGPFNEPVAVVATLNGRVWVLDASRQGVYQFDALGTPFGKLDIPEASFYAPRGLALFNQADGEDVLAVADTGTGQLKLFTPSKLFLGTVGTFGNAPGQLNEPVDVLRDAFGAYYITEGANIKRWQRVNPFGKSMDVWSVNAPDALNGSHLTWAADGSIFMTNSGIGSIQRYAPDGTLLGEWRSIGPITLQRPVGIFIEPQTNRLFVTDIGSGEVYVFQIDGVSIE